MKNPENNLKINVLFFFFEDHFFKWPIKDMITSFANHDRSINMIGFTYPVSICTLFSNPRRFFRQFMKNNFKIMENVRSVTLFSLLPINLLNKNRFLTKIHSSIFNIQIKRYLEKMGYAENAVTWIYSLDAFPSVGKIPGSKLLVYDCKDEYIIKENTVVKSLEKIENELLTEADMVFALSSLLFKTKREKNKNCFYVQNGVDFNFFKKADSPDTQLNEEMVRIPKPVVGYLGNVRWLVDFELMGFLADNLDDVSFVFVGPIEKNVMKQVRALRRRRNVYFLGMKDKDALPGILKGFEVCIAPFTSTKFILATNPLKFWEYLATGRPILSLRIPDCEPYKDAVSLYTTKEEALDKLKLLLKGSDPELKKRRMEIAKANDISLRSKQYYEILVNCMNKKYPK